MVGKRRAEIMHWVLNEFTEPRYRLGNNGPVWLREVASLEISGVKMADVEKKKRAAKSLVKLRLHRCFGKIQNTAFCQAVNHCERSRFESWICWRNVSWSYWQFWNVERWRCTACSEDFKWLVRELAWKGCSFGQPLLVSANAATSFILSICTKRL